VRRAGILLRFTDDEFDDDLACTIGAGGGKRRVWFTDRNRLSAQVSTTRPKS